MNTKFIYELDILCNDISDIIYAYDKSDNYPNFIEQHKQYNISGYQKKKLFDKCKYIRNKYNHLFKKIDYNISKKLLYKNILDNMLSVLNNIYDLYFLSDINNITLEYPTQNKNLVQKKIIKLIKNNIFNL